MAYRKCDERLGRVLDRFDPEQYDLKLLDAKSRFEEASEHTRLPQPVSDTELQDMVLPIIREYTEHLFKE